MKYAVIAISGSQFKIEENQTITISNFDAKEGDTASTDQVLLVADDDKIKVGTPTVTGSTVEFKILKHYRGEKVRVFKYKSKSRYQKTKGFRADLTDIQILKIKA